MHTFSCGVQTINIDDHIVAQFDCDPDDYSICRLTVWHEGGEATITRFARNGLVIDSVMIPPPSKTEASAAKTSAAADPKGKSK